MTKKEVLDWLYRIKSKLTMYFPLKWVSECEQAIDYAIKALENQKSMVEEFESLKAEIRGRCRFSINKIDVLDTIDKHISELKGE